MDFKEYNKKQYNKLRHQYKELKQEYNNLKHIQEKLIPSFTNAVNQFVKDNNLPDPFTGLNNEPEKESRDAEVLSSSLESKSLYRQIMIKTHPDKKNNKKELYINATAAKKENNLHELIDIGKKLNLKLEEITSEQLAILESNIFQLKQKTQNIKESFVFVWFHANNNKRIEIICNFLDRVKYNEN